MPQIVEAKILDANPPDRQEKAAQKVFEPVRRLEG